MKLSCADLDEFNTLYEHGRYLTLYEKTRRMGPLSTWEGPEAMVLAGRLAANLGSNRAGGAILLRAVRQFPHHAEVRYHACWHIMRRLGPLAAMQFADRNGDASNGSAEDGSTELQADRIAQRAHLLAMLRDFEKADQAIDEAIALAPEKPWLWLERAAVLGCEDLHVEALAAGQKSLQLQPYYRPAVQWVGHLLVQQNRDAEAFALLREAAAALESGSVWYQLACLEIELGHYQEAHASLSRAIDLLPLLPDDKDMARCAGGLRSDIAYYLGDYEEARRLAQRVDTPFYRALSDNLAKCGADAKRVELPVPFVRQHFATCAPATLAAICSYWGRSYEHLEVAETICYDGTPAHNERRWIEGHGFRAREFRVTWESAQALIDAGVPFTLTTVLPHAAHAQAVFGYDSRRGVLLIRDPNERHFREALAEELIERSTSTGPRGMAFVPQDDAARLDAMDLPEAELYDGAYALHSALDRHDRDAAEIAYRKMAEMDGGHRLTLHARASMASYDADLSRVLRQVEQLLEMFPDDVHQWKARLRLLRELGTRGERIELLKELYGRAEVDPVLVQQYVEELLDDAREKRRTAYLLRRAMRARPIDPENLRLLASWLWAEHRREEACEVLRYAACLEDKNESRSYAYFTAARYLKRTDEVLRFLHDRFTRFGAKKSWPAQTLATVYDQLERPDKAFSVVEAALDMRPNDGELILFAADLYSRYGRDAEAEQLLVRPTDGYHRFAWLRLMAWRARYRNELAAALKYGREYLEADPCHREMNDLVAGVLCDLRQSDAAESHFRQLIQRFPRNYGLRQQLLEWLDDEPARREEEIRKLLDHHPDDPWAHRELAITLCRLHRFQEAMCEADHACRLEPGSPVGYFVHGIAAEETGDIERARDDCRRAIAISVDYEPAMRKLVALCDTKREREESLDFVYGELVRQVTLGDALQAFREVAVGTFHPDRLLAVLREALEIRPDLSQAWSAVVVQLLAMERYEESLATAQTAAERFPLLPRTWLDVALACRELGRTEDEVAAVEKALSVRPNSGAALRQLADAHRRSGNVAAARATLERAIACEPLEITHQGELADLLWATGRREEAIAAMQQAVERAPRYEWGWCKLRDWSQIIHQSELVVELARRITEQRPEHADSWMLFAETLAGIPEHFDEALAAVAKAVELEPRLQAGYALQADLLVRVGRFDEAIAACRPPGFGDRRPAFLRLKESDVEFHRGRNDEALGLLQAIVRDDPEDALAWIRLADCYERLEKDDEYLAAAAHLVRIAPRHPAAWGYMAAGLLRKGDRSGAKEQFRKAFALDNSYLFAGMQLLQMQLEDREFTGAQETNHALAPYIADDVRLTGEIRIAAGQGDRDTAEDRLRYLCACPMEDVAPLRQAVEAMRDAGFDNLVRRVLTEALIDPKSSPQIAAVWAEETAREEDYALFREMLARLVQGSEAWCILCQNCIEFLGSQARYRQFRQLLKKYKEPIQRSDLTWAAVGRAYQDFGEPKKIVRWMSDWQEREAPQASMLFPLVWASMDLRNYATVVEVAQAAVCRQVDFTTSYHFVLLAAGRVMLGSVAEAREAIARVNPSFLNEFYHQQYQVLSLVLESLAAESASQNWRSVRRRVQAVVNGMDDPTRNDSITRCLLPRCNLLLARHFGRRFATLIARLRVLLAS